MFIKLSLFFNMWRLLPLRRFARSAYVSAEAGSGMCLWQGMLWLLSYVRHQHLCDSLPHCSFFFSFPPHAVKNVTIFCFPCCTSSSLGISALVVSPLLRHSFFVLVVATAKANVAVVRVLQINKPAVVEDE